MARNISVKTLKHSSGFPNTVIKLSVLFNIAFFLLSLSLSIANTSSLSSPVLKLKQETTTETFPEPSLENITLDVIADKDNPDSSRKLWRRPRFIESIPEYFFYYENQTEFLGHSEKNWSCPFVLRQHHKNFHISNEIPDFRGIWAACKDWEAPEDCAGVPSSPCHPFINFNSYSLGIHVYRTIKIRFISFGLAFLRLSMSSDLNCWDFSPRKDPLSPCKFIPIQTGSSANFNWQEILFTLDRAWNVSFSDFRIDLISRFQPDVVLIDKIEVVGALLCGDNEECPQPPTTPFPTNPPPPPFINTTLDTNFGLDLVWLMPSMNINYFHNVSQLKEMGNYPCEDLSEEELNSLSEVVGLWSLCYRWGQNQPPKFACLNKENWAPKTVKVKFALFGLAALRLNVIGFVGHGSWCIDYAFEEDPESLCEFVQIETSAEDGWKGIMYRHFIGFRMFEVYLIAGPNNDNALLDKIEASSFFLCDDGVSDCSDENPLTTLNLGPFK